MSICHPHGVALWEMVYVLLILIRVHVPAAVERLVREFFLLFLEKQAFLPDLLHYRIEKKH